MSKQKPKPKKLGYKQYEGLLAQAHNNLNELNQKHHELQSYFIAYVEFKGDKILFNDWMTIKLEELKKQYELQKNDKPNGEHLETSPANEG
jgi:hypothetical protein